LMMAWLRLVDVDNTDVGASHADIADTRTTADDKVIADRGFFICGVCHGRCTCADQSNDR
jgi:hypothetical protein